MNLTLARSTKSLYVRLALCIVLLITISGIAYATAATPVASAKDKTTIIRVSTNKNRTSDVQLHDQTLKGDVFIFVKPDSVKKVYFFLDPTSDQYNLSKATSVQYSGNPFDLKYTASNGTANRLDTKTLKDGNHQLVVLVYWEDGYISTPKVVPFKVRNGTSSTTTTKPTTTSTSTTTSTTTTTTTTTSTTIPDVPPVSGPQKAGYSLVWNDEFASNVAAGGSIPGWSYTTGSLDRDLGCYTKGNVSITGGALHILTKAEKTSCSAPDNQFTVGEVTSGKRVDPLSVASGVIRIEMRAQMPDYAQNVWPGLWTRNGNYGGVYGEADLIEQWGDDQSYYGSDAVIVTTHNGCGGCDMLHGTFKSGIALDKSLQNYAVEIDTKLNEIRYYFNDKVIKTHKASDYPSGSTAQKNFITMLKGAWNAKLTMQVSAQNQWHDTANPATFKTTDLIVDYVRMYTKN